MISKYIFQKAAMQLSSMKKISIAAIILLALGCKKTPDIGANYLGGGVIMDSSIYNPQEYLVSASNPNPTSTEAAKPVIIASHGYSASTFEWDEFRQWSAGRTDYSISQVLLAGHGTTYDDFKKSTWLDWQSSIKNEYNKLVTDGYKNIDFAVSSTSCTLVLDMIHSGFFNNATGTVHIFMIDPVVIPSDKSLSLIGIIGPMLGYVTSNDNPGEEKYYYHYRPEETLQQLEDVLNVARKELQRGFTLPANVYLKVYKSKKDPTADPVSAVLIYNGIKTSTGNHIDLDFINSSLHVFTRLNLVPNVTALDRQNQLYAFTDMTTRIF
jgi:carboxylesterase